MASLSSTRRSLMTAVCAVVWLSAASDSRSAGRVVAEAPQSSAERDVLFLAPGAPVVIRIRCWFDGADVATSRQSLAAALVKLLDANRDGMLGAGEAERIPAYGQFGEAHRVGDEWARLDALPQDGVLSTDEVAAHVATATPVRIQLAAAVSARARILDLRRRLDRDGDGLVLPEELRSAHEALRMCDVDDDGAFSLVELEALSQAATRDRNETATRAALLPFVPMNAVPPEKLAELLTRMYPMEQAANKLEQRVPDYAVDVYFDGRPTGVIQWSARTQDGEAPAKPLRSRRRSDPLTVNVVGADIELNWMNAAVVADLVRDIPTDRFRAADRNGNKYVEPSEFAGLDLPGREFDDVDYDGNGEIVKAELDAFVEQELFLARFRVSASVGKEAGSLFEELDTDNDRRLTPRELLASARDDVQAAVDDDGAVPAHGAAEQNRLTFVQEVARLSSDQVSVDTRPRRSAGRKPVIAARTEGPLWFRKMDRNQDGDVSWREFLGPAEAFVRLDANGDTLIDAEEAAAEVEKVD